jgi:hypothetical protein
VTFKYSFQGDSSNDLESPPISVGMLIIIHHGVDTGILSADQLNSDMHREPKGR